MRGKAIRRLGMAAVVKKPWKPVGTSESGEAGARQGSSAHCAHPGGSPSVYAPLTAQEALRTAQLAWAFWSEDSGQGLVEYALIIALVAVGLIAILLVLRNSIGNVFNNAATQLNNAPSNPYP